MQKLALICCSALAATAAAQCTPNTLVGPNTATNQGNTGGCVYFDLTVSQTITITDWNFRAATISAAGMGFMEVYLGPATWVGNNTNASLWTLVDTTQTVSITAGVVNPAPLLAGIVLAPGNYGVCLRSQLNVWNHGYSNPGAPNPVSTPELTLNSGGATNGFLQGTTFQPRHWNGTITYTCGGTPNVVATSEPYGEACYGFNTSLGEITGNASTSLDIADQVTTHVFNGASYDVSATATPNGYVAPGGGAVVLPLAASLDVASVATALGGALPFPILYPRTNGSIGIADDLEVSASGYITPNDVGGSGATAPAPGVQQPDNSPTIDDFFVVGVERWAPLWQSMVPIGNVWAEVDLNGDLVISWVGVAVTGVTGVGNTFQIAFSPNGDVEYRIDTSTTGQGGGPVPVVVGWSQGNGALVNEIDISGIPAAPFITDVLDNPALDLSIDMRPVLGTNPSLIIDGYDQAQVALGFVLFDFVQINPGVSLTPFGLPGCFNMVPLTAANRAFLTGGTAPASLVLINGGIPTTSGFNGLEFYAQAAALQVNCAGGPCNPIGVTVSNGLRIFFGAL